MDEGHPQGITFQPDIYPRVLSCLPPPPARLLDVGAGEGHFSQLAAQRGYAVEACDFRREAFRLPAIPFHVADLNARIPLPDAGFDVVVSIEVIEHLENQFQFTREILRVTRPGGLVVLTTPNVLSLSSRAHFCLYGTTDCAPRPLDPTRDDYFLQHIHPISLPQILFMLERFGGEPVALETNRMRRGARLPARLLRPLLSLALQAKWMRRADRPLWPLYRRHLHWMLHPANLAGRITIVVARRVR